MNISSSSFVTVSLNPPTSFITHKTLISLSKSHNLFAFTTNKSSLICFSSSHPEHLRDEQRWLREEQRWLREEQRWLREEQRWIRDRDFLLREISALKLQIKALEDASSVAGLLQEKNLIPESGSSAKPVVRVLEASERKVLRIGSQGEEVRSMQEALHKLGFYSGEEDMEFSSFSSGTERAVKTWQATLGAPENGIMTSKLLERLYMEQRMEGAGLNINSAQKESTLSDSQKENTNGVVVASITEFSELKHTVAKEGVTDIEASQHRVFLLGENRWEEPSRLGGRDQKVVQSKSKAITKCLTCRGEGRVMCTECDGTGEPNVEPQFLEWVGEGAKCPYCEGLGYTICDLCEGKTMI
ncbi:PG_binding_1 domain-containing protein [Cephalotus follicularis]|uniref:PG_binding_1 domain-containing protein n=1 Tax=Cephalotus follicularis TaxID=3775 RepID=A0A1Q3BDY5_CEPFO|nr:PG_binding_1 domain-containing protein [Cephalotus follicularis]